MTAPQLLTVRQVAARLAISEKYAYRLVAQGRIATVRMGRKAVRVSEQAVAEYVASCTNPARPARRLRVAERR